MTEKSIFFDHSSTTPMDTRVLEAMLPYFVEKFGNPSSHIHPLGQEALKAIDDARKQVAELINSQDAEILFTSGATESNNLAVKGLIEANPKKGKHILVSEVEHFSVLRSCKKLEKFDYKVELIPVDEYGTVKIDQLKKMLRPDTVLVSIMTANTEIGTIEPIKQAVQVVKEYNPDILFHTDATSAAGWIPIDVKEMGVDTLTLSAHNFYGPKGVGALYVKKGVKIESLLDGGFQEGGIRSGTENVPGIVGMAEAGRLAIEEMEQRKSHLELLQKHLWGGLEQNIKYIHFTGHPQKRLPGHVSFWVEFAEGESILLFLRVKGIFAASGSACASNLRAEDEHQLVKSHVLAAVGVPQDICSGSICFLMGKDNTIQEVNYVIENISEIIKRLWSMSPAYSDFLKKDK